MNRLLAALVLFGGCNEVAQVETCGTFNDVPVDPDGNASEAEVAYLESAIDRFAAETGRTNTCMAAVRVVPQGERDGIYGWSHEEAWGEPGWLPAIAVRRTLCSQLDATEGLSAKAGDLFGLTAAERRLAFIYACANGPEIHALDVAFETCGTRADQSAYILQHVYRNSDVARIPTGPLLLTPQPFADDVAYDGWPTETPAGFAAIQETKVDTIRTYAVIEFGFDGTLLRERPLGELESGEFWHVLGGDAEPIIVLSRDDGPTEAWRWIGETIEVVPFPDMTWVVGAQVDGNAYVLGGSPETRGALYRIDLATGGLTVELEMDGSADDIRSAHGRVTLAWYDWSEEAHRVRELDVASGRWTNIDVPYGVVLSSVAPMANGNIMARWLGHTNDSEDGIGGPTGLAVYDRTTQAWTLSDDPCTNQERVRGFLVSTGNSVSLLTPASDQRPSSLTNVDLP